MIHLHHCDVMYPCVHRTWERACVRRDSRQADRHYPYCRQLELINTQIYPWWNSCFMFQVHENVVVIAVSCSECCDMWPEVCPGASGCDLQSGGEAGADLQGGGQAGRVPGGIVDTLSENGAVFKVFTFNIMWSRLPDALRRWILEDKLVIYCFIPVNQYWDL